MPSSGLQLLDGALDDALQTALGFEGYDGTFLYFRRKIQGIADATFNFSEPVQFPQRDALYMFVQKSIAQLNAYLPPIAEVELRMNLQRYGATYLAWKSGYFERPKPLTIKLNFGLLQKHKEGECCPPKAVTGTTSSAVDGITAVREFLGGCLPPMSHLLDKFLQDGITGELHLSVLARRERDDIRQYLSSKSIGRNALEVEALVLGLLAINR